MKVTPKSVSTRVVKTRSSGAGAPVCEMSKATSTPWLRPIQLRCIVRILSGQSTRPEKSSSSST